jgi:hypothetical protein
MPRILAGAVLGLAGLAWLLLGPRARQLREELRAGAAHPDALETAASVQGT